MWLQSPGAVREGTPCRRPALLPRNSQPRCWVSPPLAEVPPVSGSPGIAGAGQGPGTVACRAGGAGLPGSGAWWGSSDWLAVGSLGAPWPALPTLLQPVARQPRAGIRGLLRDLQVAWTGVLPAQGLGQVCLLVAAMGEDGRKGLGPRLALCAPRLPLPPGSADPLSAGRAPAAHSSGSKGWETRGNRISPFPGLEKKLLSHPPYTEGKTGGRESCLAGLWLLPGQGERGSGRGARAWGGGPLLHFTASGAGGGEAGCSPHQSQFRYTRSPRPARGESGVRAGV